MRCNIESVQSTLPWQFFKFLKMLVKLSLVPSRLEASSPHWSVHFPLDTLICQWLSQTPRADVQPRTQYNLLAMVHWYCARFPLCLGYKISTYMSLEWIRFLKLYSTSKCDTYIENCTVQKNAVQGAITKQASTLLPPKSRAITAIPVSSLGPLPPPPQSNFHSCLVIIFLLFFKVLSSKYVSHLTLLFSFPSFKIFYKWSHINRHSFVPDLFYSMVCLCEIHACCYIRP